MEYSLLFRVSNGTKIIKKSTKNARVIVKNKAVPLFMKHRVYGGGVITQKHHICSRLTRV